MTTDMKNDALRKKPEAYPRTLAEAYHIASRWHSDGGTAPPGPPGGALALVTEEAHVTASKDPVKKAGKTAGPAKKKSLTDVECYLCEKKGHYAKNCPDRKSSADKVHVSINRESGM